MNVICGSGTLYFKDKRIGEIQECNVTFDELEDVNPIIQVIREPAEATFECKLSRTTFLSIVHGHKVTNNWLKMHGGIMTRRYSK